jgi:hypothetical protein
MIPGRTTARAGICSAGEFHQWVALPGGGYWQASFSFDHTSKVVVDERDEGIPLFVIPVIGWRYCLRCEESLPITVGISGSLEALEPDGGIPGSRDVSDDDMEVRIVFHPDDRTGVGRRRSLADAPEWVTKEGRSLLAQKAARWEAAQSDAPENRPTEDDIRQRAAEIKHAWASLPADKDTSDSM